MTRPYRPTYSNPYSPSALYARALEVRFGDDIAELMIHRNLMRLKESR